MAHASKRIKNSDLEHLLPLQSKEIFLNSAEEVDGVNQTSQDNEAILGWRFWYGHPSQDTLRVHLLYHTYCAVQWEASMRVVSVEAAVYNDAIKM